MWKVPLPAIVAESSVGIQLLEVELAFSAAVTSYLFHLALKI